MVANPASPLGAYTLPGECRRFTAVREATPPAAPKPRLLDRVREALRIRHYSRRTEEAYIAWIRRYVLFHNKRHPAEMGAPEVTRPAAPTRGRFATEEVRGAFNVRYLGEVPVRGKAAPVKIYTVLGPALEVGTPGDAVALPPPSIEDHRIAQPSVTRE